MKVFQCPLKSRVFGYKEVYFSIRRYSPVQGLCRFFLFIVFFLFRLGVSRQMNFPHEVKDNIYFLKTLAVYLLRRMDNDFVQGLCRFFLFIVFFLFRLGVSRQMNFPHEVKDNIYFLKTLAVYLLRRMDNDFLHKFIDDSRR